MNAKTRATLLILVMSLLAVLIAPTAMAGITTSPQFRESPLAGVALNLEREKDEGRDIEL